MFIVYTFNYGNVLLYDNSKQMDLLIKKHICSVIPIGMSYHTTSSFLYVIFFSTYEAIKDLTQNHFSDKITSGLVDIKKTINSKHV